MDKARKQEMTITNIVKRFGEWDGVCKIVWLPSELFNGVVKNKGRATDLLGVYHYPESDGVSLSVHSDDDIVTLFPVPFGEFEESVRNKVYDYLTDKYRLFKDEFTVTEETIRETRKSLRDNAVSMSNLIGKVLGETLTEIEDIVKACGGMLETPAETGKETLYAYYEDFDGKISSVAIHGLRWDDELGLTLCTDDMLNNYQVDTGYCFEYFYDFEGEDLENLGKALADPAYFVEMDKYDLVRDYTAMSIIKGLPDYL